MSRIKGMEIAPPSVGTDLHRERDNPDDNKKEKGAQALTVEQFVDEVKGHWEEGREVIGAGMSKRVVERWYEAFGEDYTKASGGR